MSIIGDSRFYKTIIGSEMGNWIRELRIKQETIAVLKDADKLISNLFCIAESDCVGKDAVISAYNSNLAKGGTIAYTDKVQKGINDLLKKIN